MKKITSLFFTFLLFQFSYAQLQSPVASPRAKVSQKVGLVNINLDYSRPSKKGRTIFGNLVPFNQIWRTGANQATTISFSDDVKINNQLVEKGEYHVYSVPRESKLDLVIYEKTDAWGSLKSFDESLIKARVSSDFYDLPFAVETFTISLGDISNAGASFNLSWDYKIAIYVIVVLTKEKMLNNINEIILKYEVFILDQWGVMHDGHYGYDHSIDAVKHLIYKNKQLIINSDEVIFYKGNKTFEAIDNVTVNDKYNNKYYSDKVKSNEDFSTASTRNVKIRLKDGSRVVGSVLKRQDGINVIKNSQYTPCLEKNYLIENCPGWKLKAKTCLLYTSPSPRDGLLSRMPSSA